MHADEGGRKKAFLTGVLLIFLMPGDILVMLTVGTNLVHNGASWVEALPFIAATLLIATLPLLAFMLLSDVKASVEYWRDAMIRRGKYSSSDLETSTNPRDNARC